MRLHEVYRNQRQNIGQLADGIVRAWEKDNISSWDIDWLNQLSTDERLLAKLLKGSKQYEIYGGDGNEPFLDSAATFANAYSILVQIDKSQD